MTENKPIIINGYNLEYIKELLYNSQRSAITTNIFEAIIDELELKTQECEALKEQYKWFDHYKEQALFNKELCNKKSDEIYQLKAKNEELKNIINEAKNSGLDLKSFLLGEAIQKEYEEEIEKLKAVKEQAELKLEKIKDRCNETLELMNKDSGTNAYAGGRCTEAGQILYIIDDVE